MTRPSRSTRIALALGLGLALFGLAAPATAQQPRPVLPPGVPSDGLSSRYIPPRTVLPPDPDRDHFYFGRRWGDRPPTHPNYPCTSGLYGLDLPDRCTACYAPYFTGRPGGTTADDCCKPVHFRVLNNFLHPWRPVGGYYAGGCAVPIYDLDPLVAGPGPFPFPRFYKRQHQGG